MPGAESGTTDATYKMRDIRPVHGYTTDAILSVDDPRIPAEVLKPILNT